MKKLLVLMVILMFTGTANAMLAPTTIANWDMYGQPGDQAAAVGAGSDHVSALNMIRGAGLSSSEGINSMSSTGWNGTNAGDYFEFGFRVADGFEAALSELWIGTRSSNTGPGTIGVYTSLDGFTDSIYTISQAGTAYSNSLIDLSTLNVVSGDFIVRLMEVGDTQADGDGATAGTGTFRITDHFDGQNYTDVQFTGFVSQVPVPGAIWLLCSSLLAMAGFRRKNR